MKKNNWITITTLIAALICTMPAYSAKRAIVIGIGDYPNVNKLRGPQQDAYNMKSLLINSFGYKASEIKMLVDQDAKRDDILGELNSWFIDGTKADDELLFYFSGHGFQTPDQNGDEQDNQDEAIAAYDALVKGSNVQNMISDDEIEEVFAKLSDRSVTMIIDSCHSGTLTRGMFGNSAEHEKTIATEYSQAVDVSKDIVTAHRDELSFIDSAPKRVVWTAVSSWQKALVDFESGNGSVFTNQFIEGIKGLKADKNKDSIITRSELLDHIRAESNAFCNRNKQQCKTGLTPTLETPKDLYVEDATNLQNFVNETNGSNPVVNASYIDNVLPARTSQGLDLVVLPEKNAYKVGDAIKFEIKSETSGYLILLDIRESGEIIQLFPNKHSDSRNVSNFIEANKTEIIPAKDYGFTAFAAVPPVGTGTLIAIVSQDNVAPGVLDHNKDLMIIDSPKEYIQDIALSLNNVWVDGDINREIVWSKASREYQIIY